MSIQIPVCYLNLTYDRTYTKFIPPIPILDHLGHNTQ